MFHCMKSVPIRIYCGPHFPAFGMNLKRYKYLSVFSPNVGKCGPEQLWIRTLFTQCLLSINAVQCICLSGEYYYLDYFLNSKNSSPTWYIDFGFNIRLYHFSTRFKPERKAKETSMKITLDTLLNIYNFSDSHSDQNKEIKQTNLWFCVLSMKKCNN